MGMTPRELLRQVELPLALPSIVFLMPHMETIASLIVLVAGAADKNRINNRKALIINMQKSNQQGTWRGRTRLPLESYFS